MNRRPTGRDVAERAGVSQATVSLVFSGGGAALHRVSEATRERVLAAAEQLGYQPQAAGRQLRLGRTGMLLLAVPNILGPFFARVLAGAQAEAAAAGADTSQGLSVVVSSAWDHAALARAARGGQYDGLLICSPDDSQLGGELPDDVPVVFLDADPALGAGHPRRRTQQLDVGAGMAAAVTHLRALGHERLGHLRSVESAHTFRARQAGFEAAAAGADVREVGVSVNGGLEAAREAARALLAAAEGRPRAVVCDDDIVAAGVYHVAAELGLRIPEDLSVVGIDNIVAAPLFAPALTTVDLPGERLGAAGVRLLAALTAGEAVPEPAPLPTRLVVRGSTGR
ncbi:LacI family DNA-binding transcriptional regulator [Streptacidiphilus jiangxiensis]|uniref:LacI family transcriptional regulator/LacI family transcriptional regulator, repressor for deo operon, udp, cdd, tsx, nupC, and nupG n=1 Tax=Streptacidiphilus jiangxiensis TaxID=235985 RepID=A0A1H7F963_STRJI|nr:LacI family DNA-binding transcriptional regulator [Streptacidiphilus jiangxiensis]SEK20912.1 LacI family transcriptional regulator/LacI family transcriptional regulator, repressor for deo operon, udp, cdd, tsx, nupC, and nupG [Streptacidiphilus jiangxiensis]